MHGRSGKVCVGGLRVAKDGLSAPFGVLVAIFQTFLQVIRIRDIRGKAMSLNLR